MLMLHQNADFRHMFLILTILANDCILTQ